MMYFNTISKILIGIGTVIFAVFSLLGFGGVFRMITGMQVSQLKSLQPGSETYAHWEKPPASYVGFYFFNLTNIPEFSKGAKAVLREIGPYIYRTEWERKDVTVDAENGTLRYRRVRTYFFDDDLTDGSETDRISIANVVLIATAAMAHKIIDDKFLLEKLDKILTSKGDGLVLTGSVRQFLFDGIPLQSYADIFSNPIIKQATEDLGLELPGEMQEGKFALLKNKNATEDNDWFTVKTGQEDVSEVGKIMMFRDKPELEAWSGGCRALNGTDGDTFSPQIAKEKVLEIFSPEMCRSYRMAYHKDSSFVKTETLQFAMDQSAWQGGKTNPENSCFCPDKNPGTTTCDKDGVFNVGACNDGVSLLLSQPHFLGAEEAVLKGVEGLEPEFDKHVTMIDFEPLTGTPLKSFRRLQYNVELLPYDDMPTFAKVKPAIVPFLWTEETTTAGPKEIGNLSTVLLFDTIFSVIHFAFMGVGALLIGQGMFVAKKNKRHESPVTTFNNGDLIKSGVSTISNETAFTY